MQPTSVSKYNRLAVLRTATEAGSWGSNQLHLISLADETMRHTAEAAVFGVIDLDESMMELES